MRDISFSSRAEQDLVGIWADLFLHGADAAERAMALNERRFEVFRRFPLGGEACPMFGHDMRHFPAGNYVIFYRPDLDRIQMVRVLDGRRDLPRAFWQD
jgi:toxin ParE1/3/4